MLIQRGEQMMVETMNPQSKPDATGDDTGDRVTAELGEWRTDHHGAPQQTPSAKSDPAGLRRISGARRLKPWHFAAARRELEARYGNLTSRVSPTVLSGCLR